MLARVRLRGGCSVVQSAAEVSCAERPAHPLLELALPILLPNAGVLRSLICCEGCGVWELTVAPGEAAQRALVPLAEGINTPPPPLGRESLSVDFAVRAYEAAENFPRRR